MATVTQLADRACQISGLQTTGTERAIVVAALNNAYQRSIDESQATLTAITGTAGTVTVAGVALSTLFSSPGTILRIDTLSYTGGGVTNRPLVAVPRERITEMYEGADTAVGAVSYYATLGTDTLLFYPLPSSGDSFTMWYAKAPPTLVESGPAAGEEATPSKIPARFHWDVLMAGAVVECLDKDQRSNDAAFWQGRYESALAQLVEWVERFAPPGQMFVYPGQRLSLMPDQRGRG